MAAVLGDVTWQYTSLIKIHMAPESIFKNP